MTKEKIKNDNPYPKDVFLWDNKEKLNFNRGRFNQHCFEIWEICDDKWTSRIEKAIEEDIEDSKTCDWCEESLKEGEYCIIHNHINRFKELLDSNGDDDK